jgi:hypothetical protein
MSGGGGEGDAGTIKIRIVAEDGFSNAFDKAKKGSKDAGEHLGGMGQAADGLNKKLIALAAAAISVEGAIKGFDIALEQARNNDAADMFDKLGGSADRLSEALGGMVTGDDVVKIGNYARSMGLTQDQMESLGSMSRQTARIMGTDVATAFDTLSSGVAMANPKLLKQAGLMIDVNVAQQNFAHSIGTTSDRLNEAGKQAAIFNAVMDDQKRVANEVGTPLETATDKLEKFKTSASNLADALRDGLIPIFSYIAEKLQPIVDHVTQLVKDLGIANGLLAAFAEYTGNSPHVVGSPEAAAAAQQANADAGDLDFGDFSMGSATVKNAPGKKGRGAFINPLTDQQAEEVRKQLQDISNALEQLGDAAKLAGANNYDAPFMKIRQEADKTVTDFIQQFTNGAASKMGAGATSDQIGEAWVQANKKALADTQNEIDHEIDSGMLVSVGQIEQAASLAGISMDELGDQIDHLGRMAHGSSSQVSDLMDQFQGTGMFSNAGRGAGGIEGQLFNMMAGGNSVSDPAQFDQIHGAASAGAGLLTGGLSGMGAAIGTAAGGPLGTVVGGMVADALTNAAQEAGQIIGSAVNMLIADKRLGAAGSAAGTGAMLGMAGGLVPIIGPLLQPALMGMGALGGAFLSLATATKSYQQVQDGMTYVIDKTVKVLEPFWAKGAAIVGLFDIIDNVFNNMVGNFANDDNVMQVLFQVVKFTALGFGYLVEGAAALYDGFNDLHAIINGIWQFASTLISTGDLGKAGKAFSDALNATMTSFGVNLADVQASLTTLGSLSYDTAGQLGKADEAAGAAAKAMNKLSDSVLNGPVGFKVEAYRYGAQSPSSNPGAGGGNSGSGSGGGFQQVTNNWDVTIDASDRPVDEVIDELNDTADKMAARNTGNKAHPAGGSSYRWRTGRRKG